MTTTINAQVLLYGYNRDGAPNGSFLLAGDGLEIVQPDNTGDPVYINFVGGSPGDGTVTSISTGDGLTGGPITSAGTISLANTTVTAGSYTNASITVDAQGRLTSASNGSSVTIATTSQTVAAGNVYVANSGSLLTFTLPTTMAAGSRFSICGYGSGGWKLAQSASGQQIKFGTSVTTSGATGYLQSSATQGTDCVDIICVIANTGFLVTSSQGNITYF